jgi:hypothetical protein
MSKLGEDINRLFQNVCRLKIDHFESIPAGSLPAERKIILDERRWD